MQKNPTSIDAIVGIFPVTKYLNALTFKFDMALYMAELYLGAPFRTTVVIVRLSFAYSFADTALVREYDCQNMHFKNTFRVPQIIRENRSFNSFA